MTHRIGAVCYILWGAIHMAIGGMLLQMTLAQGGVDAIAGIYSGVPSEHLPQAVEGVSRGLLLQHGWNLLWFGLFALVVGAWFNWRNSVAGYWSNLAVISAADLGFVFPILIPGYIGMMEGIMGPLLWVAGAVFTTLGMRQHHMQAVRS